MRIMDLRFQWPGFLALLVLLPLLAAAYLLILRRKKKHALRYSSLALLLPAVKKQSALRRHIPAALYLLALSSLLIALARPIALLNTPTLVTTVLLVLDVSSSMNSTDIAPSRLKAAEAAALSFIQRNQENAKVGIVIFSSHAALIVPPTTDRARLSAALASLITGDNTAMGSGIFTALDAIPEDRQKAPLPNASAPEIIILLTDGENNIGPQPLDAARAAAARGVRIYTIGLGSQFAPATKSGAAGGLLIPNTSRSSNALREGDHDDTLEQIAAITNGRAYTPENAAEMEQVFARLARVQASQVEAQEASFVFTTLGALLACAAMLAGLAWHPLP